MQLDIYQVYVIQSTDSAAEEGGGPSDGMNETRRARLRIRV